MNLFLLMILLSGNSKFMSFTVELPPGVHPEKYCCANFPSDADIMDGRLIYGNKYQVSIKPKHDSAYIDIEEALFKSKKFLSVNNRKGLNLVEFKLLEAKRYMEEHLPTAQRRVKIWYKRKVVDQVTRITEPFVKPFRNKQPQVVIEDEEGFEEIDEFGGEDLEDD